MDIMNRSADLQQLIDQAAPGAEILLPPGDHRCKLLIRTPGLKLRGAGMDRTRILWDDYALKKDELGRDYNTFRTWTVAVCADGVSMEDLSIVNEAGHPEEKGQEVALSVCADSFTMERCHLRSTQDTLFLGPLPADLIARYEGFLIDPLRRGPVCRQRLRSCLIEGSVDFVFGCGEALLEDCELRSVYDVRQVGYVAAPAHAPEQEIGFTFRRCRFTAEEAVEPASIWLARPWRDYGLACFEDCVYGPHIHPLGFDKWNDTNRDRTARFSERPKRPGRQPWTK